jgi:hypothetical protein
MSAPYDRLPDRYDVALSEVHKKLQGLYSSIGRLLAQPVTREDMEGLMRLIESAQGSAEDCFCLFHRLAEQLESARKRGAP